MGYGNDLNGIGTLIESAVRGEDGKRYKVVAVVLRNTDGISFQPIVDSVHEKCNVASVTTDATKITVNFSFTAKRVVSFVATPDDTFAGQGLQVGASVGQTLANIYCARPPRSIGGYISYNGSAWVVAAGASGNLAVTSYDPVTGTLTLSHDNVGDLHSLAATPRDGGYDVRGGSVSNTSTQIKFYNSAGTQILTPDTNMKFFLMRGSSVAGAVDPRTLTTANSNIWCLGIFEV